MTIQLLSRNTTMEKIQYHDLNDLEGIFTTAFGDELNADRIKQRLMRVRQFYYLLLPLSSISLWARNLFNIYICRVDNEVAGFMQISYMNSRQLHLDFIAVRKQYRGQGLGTWMLRKLLNKVSAQKRYDIILEVKAGNPAYHLYSRLGFINQTQMLHYEVQLEHTRTMFTKPPRPLAGLRRRRDADWPQLYQLYYESIPKYLHRVALKGRHEFHPSLLTRSLEWLKDRLMRNLKRHYVIEKQRKLIGAFELHSYPNTGMHIINAVLHPNYEFLREKLLRQALYRLQRYRGGTVRTTIYNDDDRKQQALENTGFTKRESYLIMLRPPYPVPYKVAAAQSNSNKARTGLVHKPYHRLHHVQY